jgi:hypothetical protein
MGRKFGFSFSWKRALGLSAAKGKISRAIGIPLTREGRRRKFGPFGLGALTSRSSTSRATGANEGTSGCVGCLGVLIVVLLLLYFVGNWTSTPGAKARPSPVSKTPPPSAIPEHAKQGNHREAGERALPNVPGEKPQKPNAEPLSDVEHSNKGNDLETNEKAAANKLALAKNLLKKDNNLAAKRWLDGIIKEYPDTKAASEAADLLKKL